MSCQKKTKIYFSIVTRPLNGSFAKTRSKIICTLIRNVVKRILCLRTTPPTGKKYANA